MARLNRRSGGETISTTNVPGVESGVSTPDAYNQMQNDASSFSLTLDSGERSAIQWIAFDGRNILVGTTGGEWRAGGENGKPITPTKYLLKEVTNRGSKDLPPVRLSDAFAFVNGTGRKFYKVEYDGLQDDYKTIDLTVLAEHITESGIVDMAFQRNPDEILWAVRDDGALLSMTYDSQQNVLAWARHPMTDVVVESVTVIPGTDEDEVWLFVQRTVDSATVRYIEKMHARDWGDDMDDMVFLDCSLTYDGVAATTITGLDHLEGETVGVLGDGAVMADNTVSASGEIELAESASTVQVGLKYTYKVKPMRLDQNARGGTSKGSIKFAPEVVVSFYQTLNAQHSDGTTARDIPWRTVGATYTDPPDLVTGDKVVNTDCGYSVDDPFQIEGTGPMPCTVLAIIPRMAITGR